MILYNILLLSLKISGNIKCFQLHNKSIAPFLRLTEFKMFKTIEWLYLILLLFIINKRCMCWKNNPQVDFFPFLLLYESTVHKNLQRLFNFHMLALFLLLFLFICLLFLLLDGDVFELIWFGV